MEVARETEGHSASKRTRNFSKKFHLTISDQLTFMYLCSGLFRLTPATAQRAREHVCFEP